MAEVLVVSGSPRAKGNSDIVADIVAEGLRSFGWSVDVVRLRDYDIKPCRSCRTCLETGRCIIEDDMTILYEKLLRSLALIMVSPVYFNSVPAQVKAFIDRTWCLRGKLRNKVCGVVVIGRRYGHEQAVNTIISFMLKHEMIVGMRGVTLLGYERGDVQADREGLRDVGKLVRRIDELLRMLGFKPKSLKT